LIPECDTGAEVNQALRELCEEIFTEQLSGWFNDETTWPQDRGFEVFCRWFDFQHHSMLVDLCDAPPHSRVRLRTSVSGFRSKNHTI
jgi:hypothetical protein